MTSPGTGPRSIPRRKAKGRRVTGVRETLGYRLHPLLLCVSRGILLEKRQAEEALSQIVMGEEGLEPSPLSGQAPKTCASARSATRPASFRVTVPHLSSMTAAVSDWESAHPERIFSSHRGV